MKTMFLGVLCIHAANTRFKVGTVSCMTESERHTNLG